jgi:hypothetical protein
MRTLVVTTYEFPMKAPTRTYIVCVSTCAREGDSTQACFPPTETVLL